MMAAYVQSKGTRSQGTHRMQLEHQFNFSVRALHVGSTVVLSQLPLLFLPTTFHGEANEGNNHQDQKDYSNAERRLLSDSQPGCRWALKCRKNSDK